jgi:hypothetical protein
MYASLRVRCIRGREKRQRINDARDIAARVNASGQSVGDEDGVDGLAVSGSVTLTESPSRRRLFPQ